MILVLVLLAHWEDTNVIEEIGIFLALLIVDHDKIVESRPSIIRMEGTQVLLAGSYRGLRTGCLFRPDDGILDRFRKSSQSVR